jgi:hypothetical protein
MPHWQLLLYIFGGTFFGTGILLGLSGLTWYGWMRIVRKQTKQQMFDRLASMTRG